MLAAFSSKEMHEPSDFENRQAGEMAFFTLAPAESVTIL
jgi:hypothetical protein